MAEPPRVLAFAGSAREGSYNKKLVRIAVAGAEAAGARCTVIDLRDLPLPIYDADLEAREGLPEHAVALRRHLAECDGLLISTPEYNGSIPPLLKNTLDWATRHPEARPDLSGFQGKMAGLMAASPGPLGGMRALVVVRTLLNNLGCTVLAEQIALRQAAQAFTADGRLENEGWQQRTEALGGSLAGWLAQRSRG